MYFLQLPSVDQKQNLAVGKNIHVTWYKWCDSEKKLLKMHPMLTTPFDFPVLLPTVLLDAWKKKTLILWINNPLFKKFSSVCDLKGEEKQSLIDHCREMCFLCTTFDICVPLEAFFCSHMMTLYCSCLLIAWVPVYNALSYYGRWYAT